jgi:hypothetical protein
MYRRIELIQEPLSLVNPEMDPGVDFGKYPFSLAII